jgi:hypothetical protein
VKQYNNKAFKSRRNKVNRGEKTLHGLCFVFKAQSKKKFLKRA